MTCVSDAQIQAFVEGRRTAEYESVRRHLRGCDVCRSLAHELRASLVALPFECETMFADRYRIEAWLGSGMAGHVYRVYDTKLGCVRALKLVGLRDENDRRRFERECEVMRALHSNNIVRVHDLALFHGPNWGGFTMDLLEGASMDAHMAFPLAERSVAALLGGIFRGLAGAHRQGVAHRDIKPANVFLHQAKLGEPNTLTSSCVRLIDFGLSKPTIDWRARFSVLTKSGAILGTPRYMAPEQIFEDKYADHRVDFWAAGVLAYRALTGEFPIQAESFGQIVRSLSKGKVVPIDTLVGCPSRMLAELVMQLLSIDPNGRPRSAEHVVARLDALYPSGGAA